MTAKEQAIQDIKNDLEKSSRCFIEFRVDLNPIMEKLVELYVRQQGGE